jgi:hypothetical protein
MIEKTMEVLINGEPQYRRIIGYQTNRDIYLDTEGLSELNEPIAMARPVPETFEGERIHWVMGDTCFITGPHL